MEDLEQRRSEQALECIKVYPRPGLLRASDQLRRSSVLTMKTFQLFFVLTGYICLVQAAVPLAKRQDDASGYGFENGEPQSPTGKGAPILGGTNHEVDIDNQANLGEESTDNGVVPNLKWRFSDSHTRLLPGGWVREQVITDLPVSTEIAAAQQHLQKGAIREIHWHRVVSISWQDDV